MLLKIERRNGQVFDLSRMDIPVLSFYPSAPVPITERRRREGVDGHLDAGTIYEGRKLNATVAVLATSYEEFALLRNEVFKIFDSKEPFNMIHHSEPRKRWVDCKYISEFSIPHETRTDGEFNIQFESTSAYSYSVGSLLDPFTFDAEMWQFGMNIPLVDFKYRHNTTSFTIWNLGDKLIDGRNVMLEIYYTGPSNGLTIENKTLGIKWEHFGTTNTNDTIMLDGVFSRLNGISIFGNTNMEVLKLDSGPNEFVITGARAPMEISFDFRFMYL